MQVQPIYEDEARGDSRPVSVSEFTRLAFEGQNYLNVLSESGSVPEGLIDNLERIKVDTFKAVQGEWGGATVDTHTGAYFDTDKEVYAITNKPYGVETVSIPLDSGYGEFCNALYEAMETFDLRPMGQHLGIFRDDDKGTIDFDPVIIVDSLDLVEKVGAATHAIGGAYCFSDGNGYWPPHISE